MSTQSTSDCSRMAALGDHLASLAVKNNWAEIETTAKELANSLRKKGGPVDEHTALGKTLLPQTLTSLLKAALDGSRVPDDTRSPAVVDLLRVGANLCMDHNENRGYLLEAGFPQTVLSLLEAYAESIPTVPPSAPWPLSLSDLTIVRTAIGVILNTSLGYEPVQSRLISLEAAVTMLRLSVALYPPGSWLTASLTPESWTIRSSLTEWSWRAISGLKDNAAEQHLFGPDHIPFLIAPLRSFVAPYQMNPDALASDPWIRRTLINTDIDVLEEVCEVLESLSLDVEDVRLALARGMTFPEEHDGQPCLQTMLDFVELGEYAPHWSELPPAESAKYRKTMDLCKAAVIKCVVETAGEDKNTEVLWDFSESEGGFVARMVAWLRKYHKMAPSEARDDLVICSTLSLGNLSRRENHSVTLVKLPCAVAPDLVSLLQPETDIKVKHGVVGLLKHLAQAPSNRPPLGQSGVVQSLAASRIFGDTADIAEMVQISSIGVAKHLCTNNAENSIMLVLPLDGNTLVPSALDQILRLVRRSNSTAVKSEGTRVLVNVIKSMCSGTGNLQDPRRQEAMKIITTPASADALAQLLGRSKKYPILIHEAIVAMMLLAMQPAGAPLVLDAVVAQLPQEAAPAVNPTSAASSSPIVAPPTALDMMVLVLKDSEARFAPEIRANLCALLSELGKCSKTQDGVDRAREVAKLKDATKGHLEAVANSPDNMVLAAAARKALAPWQ